MDEGGHGLVYSQGQGLSHSGGLFNRLFGEVSKLLWQPWKQHFARHGDTDDSAFGRRASIYVTGIHGICKEMGVSAHGVFPL